MFATTATHTHSNELMYRYPWIRAYSSLRSLIQIRGLRFKVNNDTVALEDKRRWRGPVKVRYSAPPPPERSPYQHSGGQSTHLQVFTSVKGRPSERHSAHCASLWVCRAPLTIWSVAIKCCNGGTRRSACSESSIGRRAASTSPALTTPARSHFRFRGSKVRVDYLCRDECEGVPALWGRWFQSKYSPNTFFLNKSTRLCNRWSLGF